MPLVLKQLGQSRPANTSNTTVFSPATSTTILIKSIYVANTTGVAAAMRIFVDDTGSTFDQSTALFYDVNVAANETNRFETFVAMNDENGNLAVRTDTSSSLTFTFYGVEVT